MKITKIAISEAVKEATGFDVEIAKCEGFYYWVGNNVCSHFEDSNTYYQYLTDVSLERWVDDFKDKIEYNTPSLTDAEIKEYNRASKLPVGQCTPDEPSVIKLSRKDT